MVVLPEKPDGMRGLGVDIEMDGTRILNDKGAGKGNLGLGFGSKPR